MEVSVKLKKLLETAFEYAQNNKYEYVTPEILLLMLCDDGDFAFAVEDSGADITELEYLLNRYIEKYIDKTDKMPELSSEAAQAVAIAAQSALGSGNSEIKIRHFVHALWKLQDSYAVYYMNSVGLREANMLRTLTIIDDETRESSENDENSASETGIGAKVPRDENKRPSNGSDEDTSAESFNFDPLEPDGYFDDNENPFEDDEFSHFDPDDQDELPFYDDEEMPPDDFYTQKHPKDQASEKERWMQYAPCLNDTLKDINPLIGREAELERTIQILCRKDKNNPLHIGEPGVGKTAITYGLVEKIRNGTVPDEIKECRVFALDLGGMVAGTQYRGDFEKRFKKVLNEISKEKKPIIYID